MGNFFLNFYEIVLNIFKLHMHWTQVSTCLVIQIAFLWKVSIHLCVRKGIAYSHIYLHAYNFIFVTLVSSVLCSIVFFNSKWHSWLNTSCIIPVLLFVLSNTQFSLTPANYFGSTEWSSTIAIWKQAKVCVFSFHT